MKKTITVLLALILMLSLAACGEKEETPAPTEAPVVTEAPAVTDPPVLETTDPGQSVIPAEPAAPEQAAEPSLLEIAEGYVGESLDALKAAIGEPLSSDYAPSCLGSGEDGLLEYADFDVYTYREGDSERVETVLAH